MEELQELRTFIEQGRYPEALLLLGEMEEMSYSDKVNKIQSFLQILLLHLIKQHAEQRTTRSWEISIQNAVDQIVRSNKRRKAGGYYLEVDELQGAIDEIYANALRLASLEAFEGRYDPPELAELVDEEQIKEQTLRMIVDAQ
ncbi:MAG: hypothetical protein DCC55_28885 [Chloroflexi bacterium]|nr:MAG: hypothetical protein DCC55_28885 [Chloroflexota bacterium]